MRFTSLLAAGLLGLSTAAVPSSQDWQAANAATIRLKPSAFPDLPMSIRQYLEERTCEVPQAFSNNAPHNVVRGRFTSAAQVDIAVLCSKAGVSSILVFRGGTTSGVAQLAERQDDGFLQVIDSPEAMPSKISGGHAS